MGLEWVGLLGVDPSTLLVNTVVNGARLFLVTVGLNLVLGIVGILNLTHGALVVLGMYVAASVAAWAYQAWGVWGALAAMVAASLAAGFAMGLALHYGLFEWILSREDIEQLIATFAALLIMEDAFKAIWGTRSYTVPLGLQSAFGTFSVSGVTYPGYVLAWVAAAVLVGAGLYILLYRTRLGLILRSIAHDREVLRAYGVRVGLYYAVAVGLGAALAAVAGSVLYLGRSVEPGISAEYLSEAFAVAVIGGLGSIAGAAIAALLAAFIEALVTATIPELQKAAIYLLMIAVLLVRPEGLLGRREVRVA